MNFDADTHYTPREIFDDLPTDIPDMPQLIRGEDGKERIVLQRKNLTFGFRETMHSLKARTDAMKEAGFDKAMLLVANASIPETHISLEASLFLMKRWNDYVSKLVKRDDSFVAAAQIPNKDVNIAINEAERAVKELGFKAIEIQGNWGADNLENPKWWPFFAKVEELDVPLWHHATGGLVHGLNRELPGYEQLVQIPRDVAVLDAFLWDAQLIISGTIFSGLLDRFPGLKIVFCEVDASWVPHFMTFMDMGQELTRMHRIRGSHGYVNVDWPYKNVMLSKRPSQFIRDHFYFVINNASEIEVDTMLPVLTNKLHLQKNIMIESDYDHAEGSLDIVRRVRKLTEIDDLTKELVCGKNAAELLKIEWSPSEYLLA